MPRGDDAPDDGRTEIGGSAPPATTPPPAVAVSSEGNGWDDEGATRVDPDMAAKLAELRQRKADAEGTDPIQAAIERAKARKADQGKESEQTS